MEISEKDIESIALLHLGDKETTEPGKLKRSAKFRFFRDKIRLFLAFDPGSTLVERDDNDKIVGVLIYTRDERAFNRFTAPPSLHFLSRALKTLVGYYGFDFAKYAKAAASALGLGGGGDAAEVAVDGIFGKIWVLIVSKEARGRGIAGRLLERCVAEAAERGTDALIVTVKTDNTPAIRVYERLGFETIGECEESSGKSFVMLKRVRNAERKGEGSVANPKY